MRYIILTLRFILMLVLVSYMYVEIHELGHQEIARQHGCIKGEINNYVFGGSYICFEYIVRSEETVLQEKMLHSQHEIIGYHLYALIVSLFMLSYLLVLVYVFERRKEK